MTIIYWYTVLTVLYIWDMRALPGLILYIHTYCILFNFHNFSFFPGLGIRSSVFWVNRWVFLWKNLKNLVSDPSDFLTLLCFGEQHESSHPSLKKRERANRSWFFYFLRTKNVLKNTIFVKFFWANWSFTHLSWATWAIRSKLLFWCGRPERFAHSLSFDLGDLCKWANEQIPRPAFFVS